MQRNTMPTTQSAVKGTFLYGSVLIVALVAAYFCIFGPRVPVAGGLGWDGQDYAVMSRDLIAAIGSGQFSAYRLLRLFPSLVINGLDIALGMPHPTAAQLVSVYAAVNFALLAGSGILWARIARRSNISPSASWAVMVLLFVNFASVRFPFFSPVTTDNFAAFLSMLSLMLYLERRCFWLLLVTIAAVFTWPIALLVNGPMLLTMCQRYEGDKTLDSPLIQKTLWIGACVITLALAVYFVYVAPIKAPYGSAQVAYPLAPLSIALAVAYVGWVARSVPIKPLMGLSKTRLAGVALVTIVVGIYLLVQGYLRSVSGQPDPISSASLLRGIVTTAVVRPGQFLVSHVVFFGIWPILFLIYMKESFAAVRNYPALYLTLAITAGFFLLSESRMSTYFLPTMAFALARVISQARMVSTMRSAALFFALALLSSRFWLPMGSTDSYDTLLDFPAQLLFMHIGPWMGDMGYAFAVFQTILIGAVLVGIVLPQTMRFWSTNQSDPYKSAD